MMTDLASLAPEFRPFWEFAQHGRFAFPCCADCGRFHWYPLTHCPHCSGRDLVWTPVADRGTIYSWTVVHHAFRPSDSIRLPYVVALVDMIEAPGVRLVTNLDNSYLPILKTGLVGRVFADRRDPDEDRIGFAPDAEGIET